MSDAPYHWSSAEFVLLNEYGIFPIWLGAELAINAEAPDAAAQVVKQAGGGAHSVLVTAVSPPAFAQAMQLVRRKGTISLVGLPPGNFATLIFDVALKRIILRGSIVGTRKNLAEAISLRRRR